VHVPGNFKCQVMFKCAAVRCWPARRRPGEKKSRCIQGHLGSVLTAAGLRAPSGRARLGSVGRASAVRRVSTRPFLFT
jgi:hypothetical protein